MNLGIPVKIQKTGGVLVGIQTGECAGSQKGQAASILEEKEWESWY